jgi:Arc/MetJ family transcription regulator
MRTTLAIKEQLLEEAKILSGARTKKETVEIALDEFVRRRRAKKLIDLEGQVEFAQTLDDFLKQRRKDVPLIA